MKSQRAEQAAKALFLLFFNFSSPKQQVLGNADLTV